MIFSEFKPSQSRPKKAQKKPMAAAKPIPRLSPSPTLKQSGEKLVQSLQELERQSREGAPKR